jgi:shikimate dehydrogenase
MTDRYCVFGNPIAHSKSPAIHAQFAANTRQDMCYDQQLAPLDDFASSVQRFVAAGGRGANVTVPFKEAAFRLCTQLSPRAEQAGAVNTLVFAAGAIFGDNTDGAGLVRDITHNIGFALAGKHILLLGAGGAARGALQALLAEKPADIFIANRSADKAHALAALFNGKLAVNGGNFAKIGDKSFDLVINATAASLAGESLPLPLGIFATNSLAYDMMYGKGETPFMQQARAQGAGCCADGLGMLVEQAAEAFALWRGVRPETTGVRATLRAQISA